MAQSNLYKRDSTGGQTFDLSSDDARDVGDVDVKSFNGSPLDISDDASRNLGNVGITNALEIDQFGGQAQSAVDIAGKIDALAAALVSNAGDELRVSAPTALDVSTNLIAALNAQDQLDVDLAANSAGTLATEQQTPVGIEDSSSTQIDPLSKQDTKPITASTTTATTDISLALGEYRKDVDFYVDVNGSATLTVEVRTSGGTWVTLDTVNYSTATTEVEQYNTAYAEIRASINQNLNELEATSKGV